MDGFRARVLASGGSAQQYGGFLGWGNRQGSSPAPFDAVDGRRLAGPQGSHPLAAIAAEELVRPSTDGLDGTITINEPVRVGEGVHGRLSVTARRELRARGAVMRLVGLRLAEQRRSEEDRDREGRVTRSESWVEANGDLFEQLPFPEPALPSSLGPGERLDVDFMLPAPRLGPPSAHLGSALIAWALEARWDVPMGGDERVATLLDVGQNLDYLRSGAVRLAPGALFDAWSTADATIAVKPLPPALPGSEVEVTITWPSAGGGRGGRIELQADVEAPNGVKNLVLFSQAVDPAAFRGGVTVRIPIPDDAPPTLVLDRLGINYTVRALVDRQFRSDLAVERSLAVM